MAISLRCTLRTASGEEPALIGLGSLSGSYWAGAAVGFAAGAAVGSAVAVFISRHSST